MTVMTKRCDGGTSCRCGRPGCKGVRPPDIVVGEGHVRRAMAAADAVNSVAVGSKGPEPGVVLMTALLLVERLARSLNCEPILLLAKMAKCLELKRRHAEGSRNRN